MKPSFTDKNLINTMSKLFEKPTLDKNAYFSHLVSLLTNYFCSDRCKVSTDEDSKSVSVLIYPNRKSYLPSQSFSDITFITSYLPKYTSDRDSKLGIYNNFADVFSEKPNLNDASILAGQTNDCNSGMDAKAGLAELIFALRRLQYENTYSLITAIFVPCKTCASVFYSYLSKPNNKIFTIGNEGNTLEVGVFPSSEITIRTSATPEVQKSGSNFSYNQYTDYFSQTLKVVTDFLNERYPENYNLKIVRKFDNSFFIKASVCDTYNNLASLYNLDSALFTKLHYHFLEISSQVPSVNQSVIDNPYLMLDQDALYKLREEVTLLYSRSLSNAFVKESFAPTLIHFGCQFVALPSGYEYRQEYKDCIVFANLKYYSEKLFQLAIANCQKESIFQFAYNSAMSTMIKTFLFPFVRGNKDEKELQEKMERWLSKELSPDCELEKR